MLYALAVLTLILVALVVGMTRTTPAKRAGSPADRIAPFVAANRSALERELTRTAQAPGSWVPEHRTDPAANRMRRERALNMDRELAARAGAIL